MKDTSIKNIFDELNVKYKFNKEEKFEYLLLLQEVLRGITDIIGVYTTDRTILFYNQAGYDFFNKVPIEIIGKKCYEMIGETYPCEECLIEKAIISKKILSKERYISKFDKYMECCCNPVMNDSGEVIFIVEQMRDITERKKLENTLKESEERYRKMINLSPDAIVITVDGKIVFANREASKYFDNLIGENISKYSPGSEKILNMRIQQIIKNQVQHALFDYKITLDDKSEIEVEVSSSYLIYNGQPAILSIMRDVTKRKKDLNAAAKVQKRWLKKVFPLQDKADMETIYLPAKTVSGDFFAFKKVKEDLVVGIIGDVSGKGISAGLNISAFHVLFQEAALKSHNPSEIIVNLNEKIVDYLGECYIAACCFSFDFKNNEAKIVGAGINQFIYRHINCKSDWLTVKGPFLGMFENSVFEEKIIKFESGDRFYFFSDGLEVVLDEEQIEDNVNCNTIAEVKECINSFLRDKLTEVDGIKDDCTLLALEMK
ncbi:SpoIIE family protein phosphatase [Oceanirhabdus sp. W0125-5]|uniref:SpoIIE family protein phosphatase n=1 Tax=Oceanirhabdus sp. W0125-5 TaxID=2999116 RepID=UPI0022F2A938|nr:SpoIIE family protein phosphatase [Oceanirhabdus sp. W0125-5]WBW96748.1 SpoIIE family protein phosphatase [Oceanirhabdus sp. W0125-5]